MKDVADYIVIGGGLTGCLIASRLSQSEEKPRVLLVEAGSDPSGNVAAAGFLSGLSLQGGEFDYAYKSDPVPETVNRTHTLNSGKALGGGSILNYGGWLPADAADYDEWAGKVGDRRWSYEGLRPWIRGLERFDRSVPRIDNGERGFDGPMHITTVSAAENGERRYPLRDTVKAAWAELGVSPNLLDKKDGSIAGLTEMCENAKDGMRQPSQDAFPLDRVEILLETVAHKVLFEDKVAKGVELADGRQISAKTEVIICAGTYRTPQVLMLSGIGPSAILKKHGISVVQDSPQVGQNLHDHFALYLAFRLRDPSLGYALGSPTWDNPALFKLLPWDWLVSGTLPDENKAKHGIKLRENRNYWEVLTLYVPPGLPGIPVDGTHLATSTMLLIPTSRGSVSIRSTNPKDDPVISPNYFSTALDRDTLVYAGRKTLNLMLGTKAMKAVVASETPISGDGLEGLKPLTATSSDDEILDRIRRTGMQHHHSGGTAAMGEVVDSGGRVIGVQNLRIADASIVPIPLGGHPQASLYAMAAQLADLIIKES